MHKFIDEYEDTSFKVKVSALPHLPLLHEHSDANEKISHGYICPFVKLMKNMIDIIIQYQVRYVLKYS